MVRHRNSQTALTVKVPLLCFKSQLLVQIIMSVLACLDSRDVAVCLAVFQLKVYGKFPKLKS